MAKTGDRVSSLASRYARMSNSDLRELLETADGLNVVGHDIRSMAMSLLRQDEHKGIRGIVKRVFGAAA